MRVECSQCLDKMIRSVQSAKQSFPVGGAQCSGGTGGAGGALEMCEEDVLSEASKQDLSSFLARVDEIGTWSFCLLASYIFVTTLELGFIHGSNATINASGDLVRGLSASNDKTAADDAINKADAYLHSSKASESTIGFNQTVVNTPTTGSTQAKAVQSSQQGQYHYVYHQHAA